jgi:hypothetical protein
MTCDSIPLGLGRPYEKSTKVYELDNWLFNMLYNDHIWGMNERLQWKKGTWIKV